MNNMNNNGDYDNTRDVFERGRVPEKNMFLYISSIVMIIFAAIGLFLVLMALIGFGALAGVVSSQVEGAGGIGLLAGAVATFAALLASISSLVQLYAGVQGLKTAKENDSNRARRCFIIGIILLVLAVFSLLADGITLQTLLALAIPGAYTYGAKQVRDQGEEYRY